MFNIEIWSFEEANVISRSLVQRTKGGLKLSIQILPMLFAYSWIPVQPAAWDTGLLSFKRTCANRILLGSPLVKSWQEQETPFPSPPPPRSPHLPKHSLAINRQNHPENCSLMVPSLGGIKIAQLMLWKVPIDNDGVFSQHLALKSPAPSTFPIELNSSKGHTWSGLFFFFSGPVFLSGFCGSKSQSEAERRTGEVRRDGRTSLRLACQNFKGIAFPSFVWYENQIQKSQLFILISSTAKKALGIQFLSWNTS